MERVQPGSRKKSWQTPQAQPTQQQCDSTLQHAACSFLLLPLALALLERLALFRNLPSYPSELSELFFVPIAPLRH